MASAKKQDYYLGLDIGTDSVGYAVTDAEYSLLKYRGEPMWGVMTFEEGMNAAERRSFRTARRRLDRKKQRAELLRTLFAEDICKIDPHFFIRRKESFLFPEDTTHGVHLFCGAGITDEEYHRRYPTIHHLILDLMMGTAPHDVRLVYLACNWLVTHRGHFLFDLDAGQAESLLDFSQIYDEFITYLNEVEYPLPWANSVKSEQVLQIMQMKNGVKGKKDAFKAELFSGKRFPSQEGEAYAVEQLVGLLSGGSVKLAALFAEPELDVSVNLCGDDETFAQALASLTEEQAEFLNLLRKMSDCARLLTTMTFSKDTPLPCISAAKIEVYDQHKRDLAYLKKFIRAYHSEKYAEVFRRAVEGNYASYSKHIGSLKKAGQKAKFKWAGKEKFCEYLKKIVRNSPVSETDRPDYEDMMTRLEQGIFLPKQKDTDNRIIPQQLYRMELDRILAVAAEYLPMLTQKDESGMTVSEKIQSIFEFRVPYFVGPLNTKSSNAWVVRKSQEKILPWNLKEIIDLDASEEAFIKCMTNTCTYLPGEDVLPEKSLLYSRFTVLNELNNLKIDGRPIPVETKQAIFTEVFAKERRVSPAKIRSYLLGRGLIGKESVLSGVDTTIHSSLSSYHVFQQLLESKKLSEHQVEDIIHHCAYSEDRGRLVRWLEMQCPGLSKEDRLYVSRQNLKGFGRLSREFLTQLQGGPVTGGPQKSILEWLWDTNENLMQLLSERYTFSKAIEERVRAYYVIPGNRKCLSERLKEDRLPGSARRAIHRTLDVVRDVTGAVGAPKKIFIEMARGGTQDQRGKRTSSRKKQLLDLYQSIKTEEVRQLQKQLEDMGEMADNRLQSDALFLYYLQMGKCAYTGHPIDLSRLGGDFYNKDHIYPQSYVKDDSVLNNLVLVESTANGVKKDIYPIAKEIRDRQRLFWEELLKTGLMTQEKFRRLTRAEPFTDAEKQGFINRQMVETRQSTKAVAELLKEAYPKAEIVYVKAGLVSEFRQEYGIVKCRSVNDLHHAKDAYLNIVVGNVYHERFNKQWFRLTEHYNVQVKKIMSSSWNHGETVIWRGSESLAKVKAVCEKNAVHVTRYAFCRGGRLFDQMPVKAGSDLLPLKKGLETEKYGGYNKPTASYYILASFVQKKKREGMLVPVELHEQERVNSNAEYANAYVRQQIMRIKGEDAITDVQILWKERKIKINTVFSFDGLKMTLSGKSSGGSRILLAPIMPLMLGAEQERYIKRLDSFQEKCRTNPAILLDERYDEISKQINMELYDALVQKLESSPFQKFPANPCQVLNDGRGKFHELPLQKQVATLINIVTLFQRSGSGGVDLSEIGGSKHSGVKVLSAYFSNWKKYYTNVHIVDASPAGLHETSSPNLLDLL